MLIRDHLDVRALRVSVLPEGRSLQYSNAPTFRARLFDALVTALRHVPVCRYDSTRKASLVPQAVEARAVAGLQTALAAATAIISARGPPCSQRDPDSTSTGFAPAGSREELSGLATSRPQAPGDTAMTAPTRTRHPTRCAAVAPRRAPTDDDLLYGELHFPSARAQTLCATPWGCACDRMC